MKWYLMITSLAVLCLYGCNGGGCGEGKSSRMTVGQQPTRTGQGWQGPGYYDGVWIQTETDYNNRYSNRQRPRDQYNYQTTPKSPTTPARPRPSNPMG